MTDLTKAAGGELPDLYPEDLTLNEYFREWIRRKEKLSEKAATPYRYRQVYANHLAGPLGEYRLRRIRRRDILRLQMDLLEDISPATVNYVVQLLHQILSDAESEELIGGNPATGVRRLRSPASAAVRGHHRALTVEEQEALLRAARGDWYYEYIAFLLCTGLRQGEGAALQWEDVDPEANLIRIRRTLTFDGGGRIVVGPPKSEAGIRDIPMNRAIRSLLEAQRDKLAARWGRDRVRPGQPVFPSSIGGTLNNTTANNALRRIRQRMAEEGCPAESFTIHTLRDTFATRFIEQGGKPQTLKTILGHSSLRMTMDLYAQVLPNTRQKEMDMVVIMPEE